MNNILLVCTANICRSPMAEAVLKAHGLYALVQSAGMRAGPRGEPVDARAARVLLQRGYELGKKWRSRRVQAEDFARFDLVLAMDHDNLRDLRLLCPAQQQDKLHLFMDFVPGHAGREVPDPYFGSIQGFEHVLSLVELGASGLREALQSGRVSAL
ncbi:low molecular weight phosphotyrosine protein phosphatase [Paucibacter sp. PLA-PC-4]|uniref:low molecular weight protein-tyrosine-phosphatase n=1 Tax=Paucibacter sp. PLA-PC-4 TaxID=2993655 RepID=UPI0022495568|nr:low molecular weight protein-tyrosine-phosphatase [Paucibacter sp. PLA-PC-4]MCX2860583.1 low molecular weight phosphotyrosine protein phosphatase [Paucibacter sp. PLA-PC-4]